MDSQVFDKQVFSYLSNIISESLHYACDKTQQIDVLYIYLSFEWTVYFDMYFKIAGKLYPREKLNEALPGVDISAGRQLVLIDACNAELQKTKNSFFASNRQIPMQIKVSYVPESRKFESKFNYEKQHDDDLFIGDDFRSNEWFEELQREV